MSVPRIMSVKRSSDGAEARVEHASVFGRGSWARRSCPGGALSSGKLDCAPTWLTIPSLLDQSLDDDEAEGASSRQAGVFGRGS